MSCYEWESGGIKLPTKIFAKFRREFIDKYNQAQQQYMDKLNSEYMYIISVGKGKRDFNYHSQMENRCDSWTEQALVHKLFPDDRKKPLKPTKKMFNFVNGKDFDFDADECHIGFRPKEHLVTWSVHENNHAVESARATKEARILFNMLNRVDWTRGSGGQIVGNNEYHRDDYEAGGGGNYVVQSYGNRK